MSSQPLTVGVEEEYLLLDEQGAPAPLSERVRRIAAGDLDDAQIEPELLKVQVEVASPTCRDLNDVASNLRHLRRELAAAAEQAGCRIAAVGAASRFGATMPPATDKDRYQAMYARAPRLVHEFLLNGMHVHVGVDDPVERVRVLNGLRPWLPVFVALTANSPFWDGADSGFTSWRTVHFTRWPISGPPPVFESPDDYERRVARVIDTGALVDRGQIYWQARLSENYPTVEIRVADVQLTVDDAMLIAGLLRALVQHLLSAESEISNANEELVRSAAWQAARDGLSASLLDPISGQHRPAAEVVDTLLDRVRPALRAAGDDTAIESGLAGWVPGALRQRKAYERDGLDGVLQLLASEFLRGC